MTDTTQFEITATPQDITYAVAKVAFPAYEDYKAKAEAIAAYVRGIEVTPSTIGEAKDVLASARKATDRLSRARIDMKKILLSEYTTFEEQVKAISAIIDGADRELRGKVRELEDAERQRKSDLIRELWTMRTANVPELLELWPDAYDAFFEARYLNKSTSMKAIESDMATWISTTMDGLTAAKDLGTEYVEAYTRTGSLAQAMTEVNARKARQKALEEAQARREEQERLAAQAVGQPVKPAEESALFLVTGTKDIALAERVLKENGINFIITRK